MRIIGVTALLATAFIGGCKKEQASQPTVTSTNQVEPACTADQSTELYNRILTHPLLGDSSPKDEKLKADFVSELTKVDDVLREQSKTWGLDVARISGIIEQAVKRIIAEVPEISQEVSASAAAWIRVLELAGGRPGCDSFVLALMDAGYSMGKIPDSATLLGASIPMKEFFDSVNAVVLENPKTDEVFRAVASQIVSGMKRLMADHPEATEFLEEPLGGLESYLAHEN